MSKYLFIALIGVTISFGSLLVRAAEEPSRVQMLFAVEPQALRSALNEWAEQAGLSVVLPAGQAEAMGTTPRVAGTLRAEQALRMLLAGSGLTYSFVDARTVAIRREGEARAKRIAWASGETFQATDFERESVVRLAASSSDQPHGKRDAPQEEKERAPATVELEEVVVTGSRLRAVEGVQPVNIYTRERIAQSGQSTVADFLNTLPQVSTVFDSSGLQGGVGTGVKLHGLPLGTTLVLIDGRRVAVQGGVSAEYNFFDLGNIPLGAVERVDVVPVGSSAVYGSDGIAGVINIILRKDFSGFEGSVKYGKASGTDSSTASLAWGAKWGTGSYSIVGNYLTTSQLLGSQRDLTSNADYTALGGQDTRYDFANPGNIFSIDGSNLPGTNAPYAAVPAGFTGPPSQSAFAATAGNLNRFSLYSTKGLIPRALRGSLLLSADQDLTPSMQLFGQLLFSDSRTSQSANPVLLFGFPGYQQFTVAAANPFNPFGETVGVAYSFPDIAEILDAATTFVQPTAGLRGTFANSWRWDFSASWSNQTDRYVDRNRPDYGAIQDALNSPDAASALNPFVAGPPGSSELVQSLLYERSRRFRATRAVANSFVSGPLIPLPVGDVEVVLGAEYLRDQLTSSQNDPTNPAAGNSYGTDLPTLERNSSAVFAEAEVPLLPKRPDGRELLAANVAARYDHYSDVGSKTTPQFGIRWRPFDVLAVRGTWGKAFKAPSLNQLHIAQNTYTDATLVDPVTNQPIAPTVTTGGNPNLKPELGESSSIGFTYGSREIPGLALGVSQWHIKVSNSIQTLPVQTIIDYEGLFPGAVTRASSCTDGPPCPITAVEAGAVNFGDIDAAGIDYDASYVQSSEFGEWRVLVNVAQMYRFTAAFLPGLPSTDRAGIANEDQNWAPRWKGTVILGWSAGPLTTGVTSRYTGKYRDYEPLVDGTYQTLGNFWLFDINARLDIAQAFPTTNETWLKTAYVELGGINVFDKKPQFSTNFFNLGLGYDPQQADIRGRFLSVQFGVRL
jgi:iron complex outermembrane receptor protein